jgi:predicted RND superfamily exporter protein
MSLTVHLIVRYRELHANNPDKDQRFLVSETLRSKFLPSFYTAITTMVAFASLIFSDIRPVIDFGWMMVIGIAVAFFFTFTLFPSCLMLLKPGKPGKLHDITGTITRYLADVIERRKLCVLFTAVLLGIISIFGVSRLTVENSFIDYFKSSTEIYQGMKLIDLELGGTTPLDVIIDAPKSFYQEPGNTDEYIDFDQYDDNSDVGITGTSFWFNTFMLEDVHRVHDYLDSLPEPAR